MKTDKKIVTKIINDNGVVEASKIFGMSIYEFVKYFKIPIDIEIADYLTQELHKRQIIPRKYKNCSIWYDSFVGTLEWECFWEYENETTYTYTTPFWDSQNGVPVETNNYHVSLPQETITIEEPDIENYNFIKSENNFEDIESYVYWLENLYLPEVYKIILQHLDNYRHFVNSNYN